MDTTLYFGVYLLLKNKVFGSLGELFIDSYRVKKGLVLLALMTEDLYLPHCRRIQINGVACDVRMPVLSRVGCW